MCFFLFNHWYAFHPINTLWNELMHRHHVSVKLTFNFSLMAVQALAAWKNVGLISIRFTGIDQLHIPYTSTTTYANWMSVSSEFGGLKTSITFACKDLPISVHNDRHFSANGFEAKRYEICTRSKQHVKIKVWRFYPESVKFHSMKLTMMLKLNFEKLRSLTLDHGA